MCRVQLALNVDKIARLTGEGPFTEEQIITTCCFATQDEVWVTGPAGEKWEFYTVLAESDTFATAPDVLAADTSGGCACTECGGDSLDSPHETASGSTRSCC